MKSIKEKAEEYTSDITNPVTNNAAFLAYKTGANYVLDEIEKIICHPLRFVNADKTIEEGMIEEISKLLEQLKK